MYSQDGEYLYTGTATGELCCINIRNNALHSTYSVCSQGVQGLAFSSNGEKLYASGGDGTLTTYVGKGKDFTDEKRTQIANTSILSISLSKDDSQLLLGTSDGNVYLCNTASMKKGIQSQNHRSSVSGVAFFPDSNEKFATCSDDNTVRLWDIADYSVAAKTEYKFKATPLCIAFINDVILTGWSDGSIRSMDSESGEQLWTMPKGHRSAVTAIAVGLNSVRF